MSAVSAGFGSRVVKRVPHSEARRLASAIETVFVAAVRVLLVLLVPSTAVSPLALPQISAESEL